MLGCGGRQVIEFLAARRGTAGPGAARPGAARQGAAGQGAAGQLRDARAVNSAIIL
jgi:hypothetical protein